MNTMELLLARMREGDLAAFEEFAAAYRDRVYALAFTLTGNREDAEDLTQEVFVKVYLGFKKFAAGKGSFEALVHKMTLNLWRSWMRKRKNFRLVSIEGLAEAEEDAAPREIAASGEEAERVCRLEFWSALWEAWGELPENYRTVLKLRVVDRLSYKEIAEITGESEAAVKSRLNRSRQALKEKLMKFF
ncbi:MAG TPA: RNA polymerase subunit sigma-24 [Peptococcaceae bacterium]|nr:MAG: RNA polymerase sigma factor [Moorella sp. 60_41]HBT47712.1 RNA polymerase subunit sigma-24 [Peptococcaceae bacterium]